MPPLRVRLTTRCNRDSGTAAVEGDDMLGDFPNGVAHRSPQMAAMLLSANAPECHHNEWRILAHLGV